MGDKNEGDEIFKSTTRYVSMICFSQFLMVDGHTNDTQVRKSDRGDQHVEAESVTKDFGTIGKKGGTTFKGTC